jgi:hypothetical protein
MSDMAHGPLVYEFWLNCFINKEAESQYNKEEVNE